MKVVRVINSLDFGGIERVYEIVARYYKGSKSDLVFIAVGKGGVTEKIIAQLGYQVIVLNERSRIPNIRIIVKLVKLFRNIKPDVMHACGAEGNFHGIVSAWIARVPVRIGEEIGMPSQSKVARKIFSVVYQTASAVIAVAGAVKDYLMLSNGVPSHKVRVLYNPVDTDRFLRIVKVPTAAFVFLSVCRLHPIKNLAGLLRAFAQLTDKSSKLWLVGDGEERANLEALAVALKIKDRVEFHGYHADPSSFFSQANAFVLPSFSEGHPVSMIEAMIAKLPVIVTKVGGAFELIREGDNGFLIDPNDITSIVAKMELTQKLTSEERDAVALRGHQMAATRFGPDSYIAKLEELYAEFINGD